MLVGELIEFLKKYPESDELLMLGTLSQDGDPSAEYRDFIEYDGYSTTVKAVRTVLEIGGANGGMPGHQGWPHLTTAVERKNRRDILYRLSKKGPRGEVFMLNGNQFRIYTDYGSQQDFCYGQNYDPRVWNSLEKEGLIVRSKTHEGFNSVDYSVTAGGLEKLKEYDT